MNESDRDLIEAASAKIRDFYEENRHHVGAALKTKSGKIVAAVHIESYIGRVTVCAEAIRLGKRYRTAKRDLIQSWRLSIPIPMMKTEI
ncbi:cytidine deaminase [Peribacillus sp. B2I2]